MHMRRQGPHAPVWRIRWCAGQVGGHPCGSARARAWCCVGSPGGLHQVPATAQRQAHAAQGMACTGRGMRPRAHPAACASACSRGPGSAGRARPARRCPPKALPRSYVAWGACARDDLPSALAGGHRVAPEPRAQAAGWCAASARLRRRNCLELLSVCAQQAAARSTERGWGPQQVALSWWWDRTRRAASEHT
jgi:hypothetical protein